MSLLDEVLEPGERLLFRTRLRRNVLLVPILFFGGVVALSFQLTVLPPACLIVLPLVFLAFVIRSGFTLWKVEYGVTDRRVLRLEPTLMRRRLRIAAVPIVRQTVVLTRKRYKGGYHLDSHGFSLSFSDAANPEAMRRWIESQAALATTEGRISPWLAIKDRERLLLQLPHALGSAAAMCLVFSLAGLVGAWVLVLSGGMYWLVGKTLQSQVERSFRRRGLDFSARLPQMYVVPVSVKTASPPM